METVPSAKKDGLTFWPIPEFDDASAAFGLRGNAYFSRNALPNVPRKYADEVDRLFFSGGELPAFAPQVDRAKAFRAVRALLSSFVPAHEAKVATVAYAFWVWSTPEALVEA